MRNTFLITLCLLFLNLAFASGPFEGVSGKSLILGVDDCSATTLLDEAIAETGINLLDKHPKKVWSCDKRSYPECPDEGLVCYSNSSSGFPGICLKNPRVVDVKKVYGRGVGEKIDKRARFDSLHILRQSAAGYGRGKFWRMGKEGCYPKMAYNSHRGGSGSVDLKDCIEDFHAAVTGGYMWGPGISKDKYCESSKARDSRYVGSYHSRLSSIGRCLELYPNLYLEYKKIYLESDKSDKQNKSSIKSKTETKI